VTLTLDGYQVTEAQLLLCEQLRELAVKELGLLSTDVQGELLAIPAQHYREDAR